MFVVYVCSVLTSSIIISLEIVSYIISKPCLLYKSFEYSFLFSCSRVWKDHAVSFSFLSFVDGVPMYVLLHILANEYIISIFIFSVASIFTSPLIAKKCQIPFSHEDYLTNRNEQTHTLKSIDSLCFQARF